MRGLALSILAAVSVLSDEVTDNEARWDDLVRMVESRQGFVHPGMRPGVTDYGVRGVFMTEAVEKGTTLARVPGTCIIGFEPTDGVFPAGGFPQLHRLLVEEMLKGEQSDFAAYLNYDKSELVRVPEMIESDEDFNELQGALDHVIPFYGRHLEFFLKVSNTKSNVDFFAANVDPTDIQALRERASLLHGTKVGSQGVIPFEDLPNHNRDLVNMGWSMAHDEKAGHHVHLEAGKDIAEGEEVFNVYLNPVQNFADEIYVQYGFLEGFPRRWRVSYNDATYTFWEKADWALINFEAEGVEVEEQALRTLTALRWRFESFQTSLDEDLETLERLQLKKEPDQRHEDLLGVIRFRAAYKQAIIKAIISVEAFLEEHFPIPAHQEL